MNEMWSSIILNLSNSRILFAQLSIVKSNYQMVFKETIASINYITTTTHTKVYKSFINP